METYNQMRNRQQKEWDAFPLYFAFGDEQIKRTFNKLGLDPDKDMDKIVAIKGTGGFMLKKDRKAYLELSERHCKELKDAIEADITGTGFVYQMFRFELNNYEYGYTGDVSDTLDALDYTLEEIEANPALKKGFEKAKQDIWNQN